MRFLALVLSTVAVVASAREPQTRMVSVSPITIDDIASPEYYRSVCQVDNKAGRSRGTGVYIGNRWVLTARHCVEPSGDIWVVFGSGTYRCDKSIPSISCDTALLRMTDDPPSNVQSIPMTEINPQIGEWICFAGFDHGKRFRVFDGKVAYINGGDRGQIIAYHDDRYAVPGNSGGPVFDRYGRIAGNLHSQTADGGTSYVTASKVREFFRRVEERYPDYRLPQYGSSPPSWDAGPSAGQPCPPQQQPITPRQPIQPVTPPACKCDCDPDQLKADILASVQAQIDQTNSNLAALVARIEALPPGLTQQQIVTLIQNNQPELPDVDKIVGDRLAGIKINLQPGAFEGSDLVPVGRPIPVPIDGTPALLPPVGLKVIGVDGKPTFTQGPLGQVAPLEMGKL